MTALLVFIRFFSETALWFGCGGFVLGIFTAVSDMTLALPVLSISAAVAQMLGQRRKNFRFFGLLPMIGVVPFCTSVGDILLMCPICFYVIYCIAKENLVPDPNEIYYRFRAATLTPVIFSLLCIAAHFDWCFVCCMLSTVLYLFLSRMLRERSNDCIDRRLLTLELVLLSIICLSALLFSRGFMLDAAVKVLKFVYRLVIYPAIKLVMTILMWAAWLLNLVLARLFSNSAEDVHMPSMPQIEDFGQNDFLTQNYPAANPYLILLVRLGGAALFLLAGYFLLRYLKNGTAKLEDQRESDERKTVLVNDSDYTPNSRPSMLDRSPEAGIRRAYAAYCTWLKDRGEEIIPSDTTRSLNCLAGLENDSSAKELRSLYLNARYTHNSALSRNDAKRAAALVKEITKDK